MGNCTQKNLSDCTLNRRVISNNRLYWHDPPVVYLHRNALDQRKCVIHRTEVKFCSLNVS